MILFREGIELARGENISFSLKLGIGEEAAFSLVSTGGGEAALEFELAGEGASLDLRGLYLCGGDDRLSLKVNVNHTAPGAKSSQLFKGILDGESRSAFDGRIKVAEGAQQTEAFQTSRCILLSDRASASASPQLEIYADDVKCSHGATCGSLDEEEQFYMRSRGISAEEARRLQLLSFVSDVLELVPEDSRADVLSRL